jgi:hypothetical protein
VMTSNIPTWSSIWQASGSTRRCDVGMSQRVRQQRPLREADLASSHAQILPNHVALEHPATHKEFGELLE